MVLRTALHACHSVISPKYTYMIVYTYEIVYISTIVSSQRVSCSNRLIGMLTTAGKSHMGDDV